MAGGRAGGGGVGEAASSSGNGSSSGRPVPATDSTYRGGFVVRLIRKDLELAAAEARALLNEADGGGGPAGKDTTTTTLASLPMATAAAAVYAQLAQVAGDDIDFSAIFKYVYGGW